MYQIFLIFYNNLLIQINNTQIKKYSITSKTFNKKIIKNYSYDDFVQEIKIGKIINGKKAINKWLNTLKINIKSLN